MPDNANTMPILLKLVDQGGATRASLEAISRDVKELRSATSSKIESLETRMTQRENHDGTQETTINILIAQLKEQKESGEKQGETIQSLKTRVAVWSATAALVGAVGMQLLSDYAIPAILQ